MTEIRILSTTDVHGHLNKGIKQVSEIVETNNVDLLIDNGDFLVGNAFATYGRVAHEISPLVYIANDLEYDVMVPGNHDLDYGLPWLQKQVAHLEADYVCANLWYGDKKELVFQPYTMIDRQNIKIAVIGLMTEALSLLIPEEYIHQVHVTSPVESLEQILPQLESEADLIMVAYHGGLTQDPTNGKQWHYASLEDDAYTLLDAFPQINSLICGHQHFVNAGVHHLHNSALIQPGAFGAFAGYQIFEIENNVRLKENRVIALGEGEFNHSWKNTYEKWLAKAIDKDAINHFIQNNYPADLYFIAISAETIGELAEEWAVPFPINEYVETGWVIREKYEQWAENCHVFGLESIDQPDHLYKIIATPNILPTNRLRKQLLVPLFSEFMTENI